MNHFLHRSFFSLLLVLAGHITLFASIIQVVLIYAVLAAYNHISLKDHSAGPVGNFWRKIIGGKEHLVKIWQLPKQDFRIFL